MDDSSGRVFCGPMWLGSVVHRKASHEAFATSAGDICTPVGCLDIGHPAQRMIFIKGIVNSSGLQGTSHLCHLEVLLFSIIIFAHFLARSSHWLLAQMTPPCERTYFKVHCRHSGQGNQLDSHMRKVRGCASTKRSSRILFT